MPPLSESNKDDVFSKVYRFLEKCYIFENLNTSQLHLYNTTRKCFYVLNLSTNKRFMSILRIKSDCCKIVARISFYNDIEYKSCLPENTRLCLERNISKKNKKYTYSELECAFYDKMIV